MSSLHIDLGQFNVYEDIPNIPKRLHRQFDIEVFDGPVDADTSVSDALKVIGVWEPWETILLASAFAGADPAVTTFVDVGANIGWFSCVAQAFGVDAIAIEPDPECVDVLDRNGIHVDQEWVDGGWKIGWTVLLGGKLIVKMDIEGAEQWAVQGMWKHFRNQRITHCLMEISPTFNDSYPALIRKICGAGYLCHAIPMKRLKPMPVDDVRAYLVSNGLPLHAMDVERWLPTQHQLNVMFHLPNAKWG